MDINQEGIKKNEGRSIKRVKKSKFIPCKGGKYDAKAKDSTEN